jgi:outer membrane receptor protein involved in Fe transport
MTKFKITKNRPACTQGRTDIPVCPGNPPHTVNRDNTVNRTVNRDRQECLSYPVGDGGCLWERRISTRRTAASAAALWNFLHSPIGIFLGFGILGFGIFAGAGAATALAQTVQTTGTVTATGTTADAGTATAAGTATDGEIIQLDVFDVTGTRDAGYISTNAESATRLNVPIANIPQNITVFNEEFIKDVMATSLDDVIMYEPTVNVYGDGWADNFAMRGMGGSSTGGAGSTFYNGFEQQISFGLMTLVNTSRVEVLKGPNAVLYGQGAFGGTVSRTSKKPEFRKRTWLRGTVNNTGHWQAWLDTQAPIVKRKLAFRLNVLHEDGKQWDKAPREQFAIAPSLRWHITKRTELIAEYTVQRTKGRLGVSRYPIFNGDPFHVEIDGVRVPVHARFLGDLDDLREINDQIGYLDFRHTFSRHASLRIMGNSERKTVNIFEVMPEEMNVAIQNGQLLVTRYKRCIDQNFENYRSRIELALTDVPTWFIKHKALAGIGIDHMRYVDDQSYTAPFRPEADETGAVAFNFASFNPATMLAPADILSYVPGHSVWTKADLIRQTRDLIHNTHFFSLYFSDLMSLLNERVYLQFGMRFASIKRTVTDNGFTNDRFAADPVWYEAENQHYIDRPSTHSAGLVWHLTRNRAWTFYMNNNATFAPNYHLEHIGGPQLKPMTGNQYEAGFKYVYKDKIYITASYYDIKQRNVPRQEVVSYLDSMGDIIEELGWGAIAGLHSRGCEAQFSVNFNNNWRFMASYACTDSVNMEDTRDSATESYAKRHYHIPRHAASAFTSFNPPWVRGLQLTLGFQWRDTMLAQYLQPTRYVRDEPHYTVPPFLEINAGISYSLKLGKARWTARVNVRNLTDEMNGQATSNLRNTYRSPRVTTFALETNL